MFNSQTHGTGTVSNRGMEQKLKYKEKNKLCEDMVRMSWKIYFMLSSYSLILNEMKSQLNHII